MAVLFVEYPKCTTCKKAKKWLEDHNIEFEDRDIKLNHPTAQELEGWQKLSGIELKKLFNTSGILYKEMKLKDKLPDMTDDEKYQLLGTDGMLVKRPLIIGDDYVLAGFKEENWA